MAHIPKHHQWHVHAGKERLAFWSRIGEISLAEGRKPCSFSGNLHIVDTRRGSTAFHATQPCLNQGCQQNVRAGLVIVIDMKSFRAEDGETDIALGLRSAAQEFQDHLPHVALLNVAGVNGVEYYEDSARLGRVGSIGELPGRGLWRSGRHKCGGEEVSKGWRFAAA